MAGMCWGVKEEGLEIERVFSGCVLENSNRVGKAKVWLSCVNVVSRKTDEKESEMYLCC